MNGGSRSIPLSAAVCEGNLTKQEAALKVGAELVKDLRAGYIG